MPVFDTAAHIERIPTYREGKALRLANKNAELMNEGLRQEIDMAPAEMELKQKKADIDAGNLGQRVAENMAKASEEEREAVEKAATASLKVYDDGGDDVAATKAFGYVLSLYGMELPEGNIADRPLMEAMIADADNYRKNNAPVDLAQADYIDPEGNAQQGSFNKRSGAYESSGNSPIAPQAGQGDISAGPGDKTSDRMALEVVGGAENLLSSIDRINSQVDNMSQSSLGLPGSVASMVDNTVSAMIGFSDQLGGIAQINGETVDESRLLDARLYQDVFSGAAANNAALQANSIGLAYALARAANPDGRISDADVRHQMKRVNLDASSKTQIQASIKEVKRAVLTNTANHLRVWGYTKTKEGKDAYDKYMKELDAMSPNIAADSSTGAPEGVDPAIWNEMTPQERLPWTQ